MEVQIVDNVVRSMVSVLSPAIAEATSIHFAVAYVTQGGLNLIQPSVMTALEHEAEVEFLIGLDIRTTITDPAAVRFLYDLSKTYSPKVCLYCYASSGMQGIYHPKLYLLRHGDRVRSIIGSSNLTEGGLERNIEVNVCFEANAKEIPVVEAYNTFGRLKFQPFRIVPDEEIIERYSEIFAHQNQKKPSSQDATLRSLEESFREKVKNLPPPERSRKDVIGWLELVYDTMPDGEFTNDDAYQFEPVFQKYFPENEHVKDKIRQQLQILARLELIDHVGRGRWKKL